ncbi:MAG: UDP-3-O-(3-hydroxymyristoyl)glucosamine N-acyltransferase, partial [Okeania sp. SIO3I5]|nr:UDP-3-O-(3-hydroxymyristoyl)glucosamine N-acyltransferase [Okeania sp. SIO3I5]
MKFSELASKLGSETIACSLEKINTLDPDIQGIAAIDEAKTATLSYIEGA